MKHSGKLSIIIPCFNEDKTISNVITSIKKNLDGLFPYEIIVVDNGSTDLSQPIAKPLCDQLIVIEKATISTLRNEGVMRSTGNILVFIDADVVLRDDWGMHFGSELETLGKNPLIVTGNTYAISNTPSWIEVCWFGPILKRDTVNYINGGQLIVSRSLFDRIRGFNAELETSEDYDFCLRAKKAGGTIQINKNLIAFHLGYPTTIRRFFHRERWHGRGDYLSMETFISSKPAIISAAQCLMLVICLLIAVFGTAKAIIAYLVFMMIICSALAYVRCRNINREFPGCVVLYFVYLQARTVSLIDVLQKRESFYHKKIKKKYH